MLDWGHFQPLSVLVVLPASARIPLAKSQLFLAKYAPSLPSHPIDTFDYALARDLMRVMVAESQLPDGPNESFIAALSARLRHRACRLTNYPDPQFADRSVLAVDIGDTQGRQILGMTSHTDVVPAMNQDGWLTHPHTLVEKEGLWFGRGTVDTHGTGVCMLTAALRTEVRRKLEAAHVFVTVYFTHDEEGGGMHGARLVCGDIAGTRPLLSAPAVIIGEASEFDGKIIPLRAHKGRITGMITAHAPGGHVAYQRANALHELIRLGQNMVRWGDGNIEEERGAPDANIFLPPHTITHLSEMAVVPGNRSTAPNRAQLGFDIRTLPSTHERSLADIQELLRRHEAQHGAAIDVEEFWHGEGTVTPADAPLVRLCEQVTGQAARGLGGGDEGYYFRKVLQVDAVTIGPGMKDQPHAPNEHISLASIEQGIAVYAEIISRCIDGRGESRMEK